MSLTSLLLDFSRLTQDLNWVYWNQAEATDWLYEGQRDFCNRTLVLLESSTVTLTNGRGVLPSSVVRVLGVEYTPAGGGTARGLIPVKPCLLDSWLYAWPGKTGDPYSYAFEGGGGGWVIRVFPVPAGGTITATVAKAPSNAAIEIPEAYEYAALYYALWKGYLKDGDVRDATRAEYYWRKYLSIVEVCQKNTLLPIYGLMDQADETKGEKQNG